MKLFSQPPHFLIIVIILAVIFGFTAGMLGATFFVKPAVPSDLANSFNQTPVPELIKLRRFLGLKEDLQAQAVTLAVKPSLAGFYLKKGKTLDILSQLYRPDDFLGNGFILTNDGWLVSTSEVFKNTSKERIAAVIERQIYEIEKVVKDNLSEVLLVKVKAENLPVVKLGEPDEVGLGQTALALNFLEQLQINRVAALNYQKTNQLVKSTEVFSDFILMDDKIAENYQGGILVNLDGEVIGIISKDLIIPVNQFKAIVGEVLRTGQALRPYLGVNFLDLSGALGIDPKISLGLSQGALIYQLKAGSPADSAGLKKNDIITKVDGQLVTARQNLTNLIQNYQPGDPVYLTVRREGQEMTVEVYLGGL